MNNKAMYYYAEAGSQISGPLPLATIRAAQAAGRLSDAVKVSLQPGGPWADLAPKKRAVLPGRQGSVAGFYEALAMFCIVMGAAGLGIGVTFAINGNPLAWPSLGGAVVSFLTALGLMATAEILKRLLAISESLRGTSAKE